MEVFSNYTFQPSTPLRRADVADVVSRVLSLLAGSAAVRWDLMTVAKASRATWEHLAGGSSAS